jgi:hypothetical protein
MSMEGRVGLPIWEPEPWRGVDRLPPARLCRGPERRGLLRTSFPGYAVGVADYRAAQNTQGAGRLVRGSGAQPGDNVVSFAATRFPPHA